MTILAVLAGWSLVCLGVGLWAGYRTGYEACVRGQLAWLKERLHATGRC